MSKLKLEEIQHYPIGENGLKVRLHKGQLVYGQTHILPVNGYSIDCGGELNIKMIYKDNIEFSSTMRPVKPILFPLSSFCDVNSELMNNLDIDIIDQIYISDYANKKIGLDNLGYGQVKIMFNNFIDFQDLIGQGKAVSVFDLNVNPYK